MLLLNFLVVVFIVAGFGRLVYPYHNGLERRLLYPWIPHGEKVIALSEIVLGLLLLTKYKCYALWILAVGLTLVTLSMIVQYPDELKRSFKNVITYEISVPHVVLHITYLAILVHLLMDHRCRK